MTLFGGMRLNFGRGTDLMAWIPQSSKSRLPRCGPLRRALAVRELELDPGARKVLTMLATRSTGSSLVSTAPARIFACASSASHGGTITV
jgi:hypothetical protein